MGVDKKKLFLTVIAKKQNIPPEELLTALIPHKLIYTHVENATLTNSLISMEFVIMDLPIPDRYLQIILSKGAWEGSRIQIHPLDIKEEHGSGMATFDKDIRISFEDLFVFEHDLVAVENENPDIFQQKQSSSTRGENNLHVLIGIFLDMLVKKKHNAIAYSLPDPDSNNKYIFQSQAVLIQHIIEEYNIPGLKKSSLEGDFSKANTALLEKIK